MSNDATIDHELTEILYHSEENQEMFRKNHVEDSAKCQQDEDEKRTNEKDDNWSEVEDEENISGNMDTMMQPIDFREFNQTLTVAPGEGETPLSLFQDKNAEFLAFPAVYAGQTRETNEERKVHIHYSSIVKWELRHPDRRVANNANGDKRAQFLYTF